MEDRYIDLRIALEALYARQGTHELRFRLALTGAWHLTEAADERRRIFCTLRSFYDAASTVIHGGGVPKKIKVPLSVTQQICRLGILKLLREDPPKDWTDVVLGA